jgi:hypothetical protein
MKWLIGTLIIVTLLAVGDMVLESMFDSIFGTWFMGAVDEPV